MTTPRFGVLAYLVAVAHLAIAQDDAAALLAKSAAAFQYNQQREKHWNWKIHETRQLMNRAGEVIQNFPSVTSESVISSDGRRCNALTAWGDGREPYLKYADPDERCQAYNALVTPFQIPLLLQSGKAKILDRSATAIRIEILPDSTKSKSPYFDVRCAAALKATVELDPPTLFPLRIEGEVAGSGCDGSFEAVVHYETTVRQPMVSQFRKGATFRIVYELQLDKFGNAINSYWISTEQHYVQPWDTDSRLLFYWGRKIPVRSTRGHHVVKEIRTTAQEFGVGSQIIFEKPVP